MTRLEEDDPVRFRLLETLRDFGRQRIAETCELADLQQRHADWYRRRVNDAAADWFSPRQVIWMKRLEQEGLNLLAALEFSLTHSPETALDIASTVHPFGVARGALTETHRWLDRVLAASPPAPTMQRVRALYGSAMVAAL